ncbi:MAG TPA: hypothetical protein VG755_05115 [Nannocystaceae bacterium]|nr:hypothetical protein [Nannocystaceae bacterium]
MPVHALLLAALVLAPDELDARVHVHGAPCPGATLAERVRAQLGDVADPQPIDVDGTMRRAPDGQWSLDLVIARGDEEPSERSFVAPHCETALDAGALVVAIAMDPTKSGAPPVVPESPPVEPEPRTQPPPVIAPSDATPSPTSATKTTPIVAPRVRKTRGLLRASGGIDGAGLPSASVFFEAAAGAFGRGWRGEAIAIYRLQSEKRSADDRGVGGRFSLWAAGARGCGVPTRRKIEIPLCAAIEAGQLMVEGFGFAGAKTIRRPWSAATLGPGVAFVLRKNVAFVINAALGIPFVRSTIEITNLGDLHRTRPVFVRAAIAFEGRFP